MAKDDWPDYKRRALTSEALYQGQPVLLALTEVCLDAGWGVDPARGRILVVGGLMASPNAWLNFDTEWRAILDMEPRISHFHMTDFMAGKKQFRNWTQRDKEKRFALLLAVIRKYGHLAVAVKMSLEDYDTLLSARVRSLTTEYEVAARFLITDIGEALSEKSPTMRVSYIMESGTKGEGGLKNVYDLFVRSTVDRQRSKIAGFRSENKRAFTPLQAADIIAWEMAHWPLGLPIDDPRVRQTLRDVSDSMGARWWTPAPESYAFVTKAVEDAELWRQTSGRGQRNA